MMSSSILCDRKVGINSAQGAMIPRYRALPCPIGFLVRGPWNIGTRNNRPHLKSNKSVGQELRTPLDFCRYIDEEEDYSSREVRRIIPPYAHVHTHVHGWGASMSSCLKVG